MDRLIVALRLFRNFTIALGVLGLVFGIGRAHAEPFKWVPACYVEGLVSSTVTTTELASGGSSVSLSSRALGASLGSGCDILITPKIAFGAMGRLALPELETLTSNPLMSSESRDLAWQAGLRLGYMINKGAMVYAIGGWSGADIRLLGEKVSADGIFWGAGLDLALAPSLLLTVEWNQSQMGKWQDLGTNVTPVADVIRLGVKYQFTNGLINSN